MGSNTPINTSAICTTCGKPAFPHPYRHPITLQASAEAIEKIHHVPAAPTARGIFEAGYLAAERMCQRANPMHGPSDEVERDQAYARIGHLAADTSDGFHTFAELYHYRMLYNALLVNEWARQGFYDVHKSVRHSDGSVCFDGRWFVVYAQLPTGQISNHYEIGDWYKFHVPIRNTAAEWDGHTPQEAARRMERFLDSEHRQAATAIDLSWVDELLRGIDKDQCEDDTGWWETSTGAEFGKGVLTELKREIVRRYHEIGATKGGAG
jgi:hypothetical protein